MPFRLGLSLHLNARPFALGLLSRPGIQLVQASPARLCDLLRAGWVDAALASSTEYFCGDYRIIPYGAISVVGPGADALLVGNVPLSHMRTIALSHASRSTNLLLRLALHWLAPGRVINFHHRPEDTLRSLHEVDGCLLIGDAALEYKGQAAYKYNLADIWLNYTSGKPLPLSCWLARPEADLELLEIIRKSTEEAVRQRQAIAQAASSMMDISGEKALAYLIDSLDYMWDNRHAEALTWFATALQRIGALKQVRELIYLGGTSQTPAAPVSNHAT